MPNKDEPFLFPSDDDLEEISSVDIVPEVQGEPAPPAPAPRTPAPAARARPASQRKEPAVPVARVTPAAMKAQTAPQEVAPPAPVPRAAEPHRSFPLVAALLFLAFGFGAGFFAGRLWERQGSGAAATTAAQPPPAPPPPSEPERTEEPKRAAKPARTAKPSRTARASSEGKGKLDVTAPAEAVVFLDGRRIGKGSLKVDVAAGSHRVEVRLGKARVGENFVSEPGVTWTYEVSPK